MTENSISKKLFKNAKQLAINCLKHPFILSLADCKDRISKESFDSLNAQDLQYFQTQVKAFAYAITLLDKNDSKGLAKLGKGLKGLQDAQTSLKVHLVETKKLDLTNVLYEELESTKSQNEELMRIGKKQKSIDAIMAFLIAPNRLQYFIGTQLKAVFPECTSETNKHSEFLNALCSEGMLNGVEDQESYLDFFYEYENKTSFDELQIIQNSSIDFHFKFLDSFELKQDNYEVSKKKMSEKIKTLN